MSDKEGGIMRDYAQYTPERTHMMHEVLKILRNSKKALTLDILIDKMEGVPFVDITVREAIWKLIDEDKIELTVDRKLRYIDKDTKKNRVRKSR